MTKPPEYSEVGLRLDAQSLNLPNTINVGGALTEQHLRLLRDEKTENDIFSRAIQALTEIVLAQALNQLPQREVLINTPIAPIVARELAREVVLVSVERAGIGMETGARSLTSDFNPTYLRVNLHRDEVTTQAHWQGSLPEIHRFGQGENQAFLILDPMLATGGTAIEVIKAIKVQYPLASIKMVALLSAPEGIKNVHALHPEVTIYTAAIDSHLNENAYIVPGLGDAGDRQFGLRAS